MAAQSLAAVPAGHFALSPRQTDLVKRTIASDCNDAEFNLFIEAVRNYGLDPFRKQIFPLVFSKDKPEKRRMAIVIGQDGQRVLASRQMNYRPASEPPVYEMGAKDPELNPEGIVKVTTYLHQQDKAGEWHKVVGEAYWSEFAPIGEEWAYNEQKGKRQPTGKKTLDGKWGKMPRLMITKCATMQALRAGWPDIFGGVYAEEEMDRAKATDDMDATQVLELESEQKRRAAIAAVADEHPFVDDKGEMTFIPAGRFVDHVLNYAHGCKTAEELAALQSRNRHSLQRFWASHKNDALHLNQELEKLHTKLGRGKPPA